MTLIAIGGAFLLFVRSYLRVSDTLIAFLNKYDVDPARFFDIQTWVLILLISILMTGIIFGVLLIFIYYQKLIKLYRFQQNFINGFTHELKTPIASLRLYLDTFKKYELERSEQIKYLDFMLQDTDRLALNVSQILNLSKLEDKKTLKNLELLELRQFIEEFLQKNPQYFSELKITINPTEQEFYTHIDRELFEVVLMNIFTNAIRYRGEEEPVLNVNFIKEKNYFRIEFSDNGIGIPKHELKNIFKKLYQVGKTTKGSGLGLYISQNIMKMHKAEIYAESPGLGKGCVMILRFRVPA